MTPRRVLPALLSVLLAGGVLAAAPPQKPTAAALKVLTLTAKPGAYLSLHGGKALAAKEAAALKDDLDFVYLASREGGTIKREFFNLSGKDTQLPAELLGTKAGIVALGWDDDLVAKCRTVDDLKRMTGSYTANSFSFAATVSNNRSGDLENRRFIFLDARGRMGLFTVKPGAGDDLTLEVRITP